MERVKNLLILHSFISFVRKYKMYTFHQQESTSNGHSHVIENRPSFLFGLTDFVV